MKKKGEGVLYHDDIQKLYEVRNFIEKNIGKQLKIGYLSSIFNLSETTLRRHFQFYFKEAIHSFILKCRMDKAMELLLNQSTSIKQIGIQTGYKSRTSFTHTFSKYFGDSPTHFLRNGTSGQKEHIFGQKEHTNGQKGHIAQSNFTTANKRGTSS